MTNAWTGGQYSLFRIVFGGFLFVQLALLVPYAGELFSASRLHPLFPDPALVWDSPVVVMSILVVTGLASLALMIGWRDRAAALLLFVAWASLFSRNPLIAIPGLPFVGWLLLFHSALPTRPYGSFDARGRFDPDSGWRMPKWIFLAAWIVLAAGYFSSGATRLLGPSWLDGSDLGRVLGILLVDPTPWRETVSAMPEPVTAIATWMIPGAEILFAPLALIGRARPWSWLTLLCLQIALIALIDSAEFGTGIILLHFFCFDPAWIRSRNPQGRTVVFYDGACGLCHRTVRMLLAEDAAGLRFSFAPLDSELFRSTLAAPGSGFAEGDPIPDSVLVHRPGEALLTRSEGTLELGHQLGGLWRFMATIVGWLPIKVLNAGYDLVARNRHRFFTRPEESCPIVPVHLRDRFGD